MASSVEESEAFSLLLNSIGLGFFIPVLRLLPRYFTPLGLKPLVTIGVCAMPWIISKALHFMTRYCMTTVEIASGDLLRAVQSLSLEKISGSRDMIAKLDRAGRNCLELGIEEPGEYTTFSWWSNRKIILYPLSSTWFWVDSTLFKLQGQKWTEKVGNERCERIVYFLSCFGNSAEPVKKLLKTSMDKVLEQEIGKIRVWSPRSGQKSGWEIMSLRGPRDMKTLAIDGEILSDLFGDIDQYLQANSAEHYYARGTPYRRGYLLHGPPGTGKTSLVHVIASTFRLPIFCLSLCAKTMTDDFLTTLTASLPQRGLLLVEDIDSSGLGRSSTDSEHGVTLSGYLNATDGFAAPEGHVLIITTNHPESLDPAILRPGRIDYRVHLTNASRSQAEQLFRNNYLSDTKEESMAHTFADKIPEFAFSPAEIQEYLLRREHRDSPEVAIEGATAWVMELEQRRESLCSNAGEIKQD